MADIASTSAIEQTYAFSWINSTTEIESGLVWASNAEMDSPVLAAVSPAAGATLSTSADVISISVIDSGSGIKVVNIYATFSDTSTAEEVYDGSGFVGNYGAATQSPTNQYNISRTGGWRSNPVLHVYAIDLYGNVMPYTTLSYVYTATAASAVNSGAAFNTGYN